MASKNISKIDDLDLKYGGPGAFGAYVVEQRFIFKRRLSDLAKENGLHVSTLYEYLPYWRALKAASAQGEKATV